VVLLPKGQVSTGQLVSPGQRSLVLALEPTSTDAWRSSTASPLSAGIYLANSMNSLRLEGQKDHRDRDRSSSSIWEVPDWVVIPGGNFGNVSGPRAGFLMLYDLGLIRTLPRIAVAQAERANRSISVSRGFDHLDRSSPADPGNGDQNRHPVSYERAVRTLQRFDGVVEQATEPSWPRRRLAQI